MGHNLLSAPARLVVWHAQAVLSLHQFDGVIVNGDGPLTGELIGLLDTLSTHDQVNLEHLVTCAMEEEEEEGEQ